LRVWWARVAMDGGFYVVAGGDALLMATALRVVI
jgi:hypothetical protein